MTAETRRCASRWVSLALAGVLLAGTIASTMVLRNLVHEQNRELLRERAAEAGLALSSAVSAAKPTLLVLGATYAADPGHSVAATLTRSFAGAMGNTVAVVEEDHGRVVARVAGGSGIAAQDTLAGARAALVRRALAAKDFVTGITGKTADGRSVLAFAVPLPNGVVAYEEQKVDPALLSSPDGKSPFGEIWGAVYAAPRADASKLLFLTAPRLPLHGTVATQSMRIGADKWFLVATARTPLGGSFAAAAPWIVFVLGVVVSLIAFAAADLLLRRRGYALALVDERTATLRRTMADLETAARAPRPPTGPRASSSPA